MNGRDYPALFATKAMENENDQQERTEQPLQAELQLHQLQVRKRLSLQLKRRDEMLDFELRANRDGLRGVAKDEVIELTRLATAATFYSVPLSKAQIAANRSIPAMSASAVFDAAQAEHQHLVTASSASRLVGFMIATRHSTTDLELDWLMVEPMAHGTGLAAILMTEGIAWLGKDRPIWLTVLKHNARAINFYRKFEFEIDPDAILDRPVPTWIMRRPPLAGRAAHGDAGKARSSGCPTRLGPALR